MGAATTKLTAVQKHYLLNWEKWNGYLRERYAAEPEKHQAQSRIRTKRYFDKHPEKRQAVVNPSGERERLNDLQAAKRLQAMDSLGGPTCVRCGYDSDVRALQIDHINGRGLADRLEVKRSPYSFYLRVIALGRNVYQVLCANCNIIKEIERRRELQLSKRR